MVGGNAATREAPRCQMRSPTPTVKRTAFKQGWVEPITDPMRHGIAPRAEAHRLATAAQTSEEARYRCTRTGTQAIGARASAVDDRVASSCVTVGVVTS